MVSIHRTSQGWNLMVSEDLGYYSSLGDVMDAAYEIARATTADLQRAAEFLEGARDIRKGCRVQRNESRESQAKGWRKHVDDSIAW
jgi:hypothetical protein